jgi:hypothetical protein
LKKLAGVLVLGLVISSAGCGSSGLSASSSCRQFSEASPEDQATAISSLSSKFDTPEYSTPLGSPEVGYYCAGNPEVTLEEFFEQAHENEVGG